MGGHDTDLPVKLLFMFNVLELAIKVPGHLKQVLKVAGWLVDFLFRML